ncbi:MAG: hypothetical protein LBG26_03435, partial [Treponema sp.]|jgi:hypothetical protein|nr:hypothetical protein [Treponema sp.]
LKLTDQTGLEGPYPNEAGSYLRSGAEASFTTILDETCGRLENSRNRGALKRIRKMEEVLRDIEDDLDAVLGYPNKAGLSSGTRGADAGTEHETSLL